MLLIACSEYLKGILLGVWSDFRVTHSTATPGGLSLFGRARAVEDIPEDVSDYTAPPLLPLELEHMIIEHLRYDLQALRTCSLVCKDWNPTARRFLFRNLRASGAKLDTLPSLLASTPGIRTNICNLVIDGTRLDKDCFVSLRGLMELTASLPRLRELELSDLPFFLDLGAVDMPHRQSLRLLKLQASCCKKEKFLSLMNIIPLFSDIDTLKLLVEDDLQDPEPEHLPSPEQLVQEGLIPSGGSVAIRLLEAFEIEPRWLPILYASLRSIGALSSTGPSIGVSLSYDVVAEGHALDVDDESDLRALITGYGTFIRQLGPSLRRLDTWFLYPIVFGHTYFSGQWDVLGLSACTNLEHLVLDLDAATRYFQSDAAEVMSVGWSAYMELLCLANLPKLRHMTLRVAVRDKENDPVFNMDWERLEDALRRFPKLQTLLIDVYFMISDHSLERLSTRLSGFGAKLKFGIQPYCIALDLGVDADEEDF